MGWREEQQHQQQQQAEEEVLKKLRSEVWSPYANTSSPSGAHSSADLGAVSKALQKRVEDEAQPTG